MLGRLRVFSQEIQKSFYFLYQLNLKKQPLLESQIASISDDVAYNNHDVEDAIRAGLISVDQLNDNLFFKGIIKSLKDKYKNINNKLLMYQVLRKSMSLMINDIFEQTINDFGKK